MHVEGSRGLISLLTKWASLDDWVSLVGLFVPGQVGVIGELLAAAIAAEGSFLLMTVSLLCINGC